MLLTDWVGKNMGKYVSVEFFHEPTHGRRERKTESGGELLGIFPLPRAPATPAYFIKIRGMLPTVFYPTRISYCEEIPDGIVFFDEALRRETVLRILPVSKKQMIEHRTLAQFHALEDELGPEVSQNVRFLSWGRRSPRGREVIEKLRQTRDERVIRLLILGLAEEFARGSSNYWIAAGLVLAELGKVFPKQVQDNMLEALRGEHEGLRSGVALMLVSPDIISEGYPPLVKYFDESAVDPLIEIFKKEVKRSIKMDLFEPLAEIGDRRVVPPLIETLKGRNQYSREEAAKTLGKIGDTRAVEPLIEALKDSYFRVRQRAADALGMIGDARAVEALTQALKDEDTNVRLAARGALEKIKAKKS